MIEEKRVVVRFESWAREIVAHLDTYTVTADRVERALRVLAGELTVDESHDEDPAIPQRFPRDTVSQAFTLSGAFSMLDSEFVERVAQALDREIHAQLTINMSDDPVMTRTELYDALYDAYLDAFEEEPPEIVESRLFISMCEAFFDYDRCQDAVTFVDGCLPLISWPYGKHDDRCEERRRMPRNGGTSATSASVPWCAAGEAR